MSLEKIAIHTTPRRNMHAENHSTRSLLNKYFTGNKLHFYNYSAIPMTARQWLYAKAFKEAVDKAAGSEIRVAQLKTPPYELCISALNTITNREIRLYASIFVNMPEMPEYSAAVYKLDNESSQFMKRLKANGPKKLMAQYKDLRDLLYNHIRTPKAKPI